MGSLLSSPPTLQDTQEQEWFTDLVKDVNKGSGFAENTVQLRLDETQVNVILQWPSSLFRSGIGNLHLFLWCEWKNFNLT